MAIFSRKRFVPHRDQFRSKQTRQLPVLTHYGPLWLCFIMQESGNNQALSGSDTMLTHHSTAAFLALSLLLASFTADGDNTKLKEMMSKKWETTNKFRCREGYQGGRQVQKIQTGIGPTGRLKYFCLTWPTPDPNPPNIGMNNSMLRMWNNTCGLYNWFMHYGTPGGPYGPPPHVHWADNEWFIVGGTGRLRIYAQTEEKTNVAG